jgi:hypothetical protein
MKEALRLSQIPLLRWDEISKPWATTIITTITTKKVAP